MDQKRELVSLSLCFYMPLGSCVLRLRSNPLLADWMDVDHESVWEVWQPRWTAWLAPRWKDSTSPNLYLRNAGGIWQDCCLQMMDGNKSWISSAINHITMKTLFQFKYNYIYITFPDESQYKSKIKAAFSTFYWSYWKQLNLSGQFTISHKWTENRPCTLDSLCRNDVWCFCSLCVLWCIGSQQVKLYARTL